MNISFHYNGVEALKDLSKIIAARKHWYSTENIILNGIYKNYLNYKIYFLNNYNNVKLKIRYINHRITSLYLPPSNKVIEYYKNHYLSKYNYISIHLRIGDVDNIPYRKYLYQSEVNSCLQYLKSIQNYTKSIVVVSDSIKIKNMFKLSLQNAVIGDIIPCHSRNKECVFKAVIDLIILKYSNKLILTRGSTFSLFGMYQNKNCMKNKSVSFIGHDYEHNNYYD